MTTKLTILLTGFLLALPVQAAQPRVNGVTVVQAQNGTSTNLTETTTLTVGGVGSSGNSQYFDSLGNITVEIDGILGTIGTDSSITTGNTAWYASLNNTGAVSNLWRLNGSNYMEFGSTIWKDDFGLYPDKKSQFSLRRNFITAPTGGGVRDATMYLELQSRQSGTVSEGRNVLVTQATDRSDVVNKTVSGAANNGSGLIRITTSTAHTFLAGEKVSIYGVTGTTEANGVWIITVIDTTHFDLVGSTFSNAYINGGTATNRGLLYSNVAAVGPKVDRGGLTGTAAHGDDVNAYTAFNNGTAKATDMIYIGHNSAFTSSEAWSSFNTDAWTDWAFLGNGHYKWGLDLSGATITNEAIKLAATQIVGGGVLQPTSPVGIAYGGTGLSAVGSAGTRLISDGTAAAWASQSDATYMFEEFMANNAGMFGFASTTATNITGTAAHPGINQLGSGVATNGVSALRNTATAILFGGGRMKLQSSVRVVALSDVTDTFTSWFGYSDTGASIGKPVDGAYFFYNQDGTYTTNVTFWTAETSNNSSRTPVYSTVPVVANQWYTLLIDVAANGSTVDFYIDGVLIGTSAGNIPTTTGRETAINFKQEKQAGTNSRQFDVDYVSWYFKPTVAR